MNRFLFWLNIAAALLNIGLFVFGKHHWWSLAAAALNVGAALYMGYAIRVSASIRR